MEIGELEGHGRIILSNTLYLSGALTSNSTLTLTPASQIQWRSALNVLSLSDIYTNSVYSSSLAPSATNDSVDTAGIGYKFSTGSRWVTPSDGSEYECISGGPVNAKWRKIIGPPVTLTAISGNVAVDSNLTGFKVWFLLDLNTINSNVTLLNPINGYDGQTIQIKVRQHATSAKTVSLGSNYRINQIALDVSSTLNSTTYLGFVCDISGGVSFYDLISQIYTA
jgi:hypothetical protein